MAEKVFKVRGQRSRSWPDKMLYWRRHAFRPCGVEAYYCFQCNQHRLNLIGTVSVMSFFPGAIIVDWSLHAPLLYPRSEIEIETVISDTLSLSFA